MDNQLGNSPVDGLSERLASLQLPITIKASEKVSQSRKLNSALDTFGKVAAFLSTPFVDEAMSAEEYQNLDDTGKRSRDMVAGYWLPGRARDKRSYTPKGFFHSYFVFDLIDFGRAEIDSIRFDEFVGGITAVLMHTLRGHTADNPKVRIIFPMFEPISLLDAYFLQPELLPHFCHLDLTGRVVGESLMDVDRPLALPSISKGDEFWFEAVDGAPIFADSILDDFDCI